MKRILVLPSWYATKKKFVGGAFFLEQTQFLLNNNVGDFRVIYGEVVSKSVFKFLEVFFSVFVLSKIKTDQEYIYQPPTGIGFEIPNNRNIPDFLLMMLSRKMYSILIQKEIAKNWRPDLIHCQSGMDTAIYANDAKQKFNIPFVITEQQVFVFHYYTKKRAKILLEAYKNADKIGAGSYGQRTQILMNQSNCNPEVIWNLVNENNFKIDIGKRHKVFTIITVLNSLPIKGFQTFVDAMAILKSHTRDFRFVMIGRGGELPSKEALDSSFATYSQKLGVFEFGTFYPFVPRENMNEVMNEAHVFVAPTIFEPHGIAAREAMMCGIPVVTTANGGVEDSVNSEIGFIVPVKSPKEMADAILRIKNSELQFHPKKIRDLAISQSGTDNFLKTMIEFYNLRA